MKNPCTPKNEDQRLAEVYNIHILDSPREVCFENITALVQSIFKTDIVAISIVDKDRQWCKSIRGANIREIPRELSFCAHSINQTNVFVVNDTLQDDRFYDNPFVTDNPKVRFYAGCPLFSRNGYGIGALCIIDKKPRILTNEEIGILYQFGKMVEDLLNNYSLKCNNKCSALMIDQLKQNFDYENHNLILNKGSFVEYFKFIRSNYLNLDKFTDIPFSNFYLAALEIEGLEPLNNVKDDDNKIFAHEEVIDNIIKHLHGDDIISHFGDSKYIILLNKINEYRLTDILQKISNDVENIKLKKYILDTKLNVHYGYAEFNSNKQQNINYLINLACDNLKKSS